MTERSLKSKLNLLAEISTAASWTAGSSEESSRVLFRQGPALDFANTRVVISQARLASDNHHPVTAFYLL